MATRLLVAGLLVAIFLRIALFETEAAVLAIILFWGCAVPLIVIRFRHAQAEAPPDAGLTDPRVRYGLLLLAIAVMLSGLVTDGPAEVAALIFTLALLGFVLLTIASAIGVRRRRRQLAS